MQALGTSGQSGARLHTTITSMTFKNRCQAVYLLQIERSIKWRRGDEDVREQEIQQRPSVLDKPAFCWAK
jgi:hypothetical protein